MGLLTAEQATDLEDQDGGQVSQLEWKVLVDLAPLMHPLLDSERQLQRMVLTGSLEGSEAHEECRAVPGHKVQTGKLVGDLRNSCGNDCLTKC